MKHAVESQIKYSITTSPISALETLKNLNPTDLVKLIKYDMKKEVSPVGLVLESAFMGGGWTKTIKEVLGFHFDKNKPVAIKGGDKKFLLHSLVDVAHDSYEMNKGLNELLTVAVKNGADINLKNDEGNTPIIYALKVFNINNCAKAVSHLIDLGANCSLTDKHGNNLLKVLENKIAACEMSQKTFFKDKVDLKVKLEKIFNISLDGKADKTVQVLDDGETISKKVLKV